MEDIATEQIVTIVGHMLDNQIPMVLHQMEFQLPVAEPGGEVEMITIQASVVIAVGTLSRVLADAAGQIAKHVEQHNPNATRVNEAPPEMN